MKRFDTYLGRIAAAAILLVTGGLLSSCNKSDDGPKLDKITVTVSEVNATATTANSSVSWSASPRPLLMQ